MTGRAGPRTIAMPTDDRHLSCGHEVMFSSPRPGQLDAKLCGAPSTEFCLMDWGNGSGPLLVLGRCGAHRYYDRSIDVYARLGLDDLLVWEVMSS